MKDSDEKNRQVARETLKQIGIRFPKHIKEHFLSRFFQTVSEDDDISETSAIYLALTTVAMADLLFCYTISFLKEKVIAGKKRFIYDSNEEQSSKLRI
jgi:hypothetical protein